MSEYCEKVSRHLQPCVAELDRGHRTGGRVVDDLEAARGAAVMDVIGGVANVELLDGQASVVGGLPGVLGIAGDDWMALGSAEFLRAWVGHPAFRLVK